MTNWRDLNPNEPTIEQVDTYLAELRKIRRRARANPAWFVFGVLVGVLSFFAHPD